MLTLIVIVLFGLGFAFLATQNTAAATFNLLGYTWTLPMYMIVFGSLLIGFFISWIVSSIGTLGAWSSLHGKDRKIHEGQQTAAQLQSRIRELELENAKLQGHNEAPRKEVVVEKPVITSKPRNFLDRFKRTPAY
jgi:uncharacterized integral membrane protein